MALNANVFRDMYSKMGINLDKLGCIMLDLDGSGIPALIKEEDLYTTKNPERFWIKGYVAGHTPHVTLLYGLLESGKTTFREYVDKVLEGWEVPEIEIDHVDFFDSPYSDEPYYCVVAHVKLTPGLLDGHKRLELLPHINTFLDYKAHITLAYVRKDESVLLKTIDDYNKIFRSGVRLHVTGINYGK